MKSRTAKKGEILYLDILSVGTQVKEKKVKMEQYGIVRSIRNGKSKHEKIQKESMVCFATVSEAKRAMTDIEHNYTMKDGVQKFTRVKKKNKNIQNQTQLGGKLIITQEVHPDLLIVKIIEESNLLQDCVLVLVICVNGS